MVASLGLFNQETLEEVLPVVGVLVWGPLLSCVTTGKAKKESTMQETHPNGGGAAIGTAGIGRLRRHGYLVVCLNFLCRTQAQAITSPFMQETTN